MSQGLSAAINSLPDASPPLLLVVGLERPVSAAINRLAVERDAPVLSLSRLFAERLADLTPRERGRRAARLFQELLQPFRGPLTFLDRTALLFLPQLMLSPFHLLTKASQTHGPLVVAWCGLWDGTVLTYARPEHPEYQRHAHPIATVVTAS